MSERNRATLKDTFGIAVAAVELRVRFETQNDKSGLDRARMTPIDKLRLILSTLSPPVLKMWVMYESSRRIGENILEQAFPQFDNPVPWWSTPDLVDLSRPPVQRLGWLEVDALKQQGVKEGFDKFWIDMGFDAAAGKRGGH